MIVAVACLIPILLCLSAAAGTVLRMQARSLATAGIAAATVSLFLTVLLGGSVTLWGALHSQLIGSRGVGVSIFIDPLAAIALTLVSFVGVAVLRYSRNYLDGDPRHVRFTQLLLITLASVETLIMAGNLALSIIAFAATSIGLHQLLLFYGDRPAARRAAAKKFLVSRLGDVCLLIAALALYAQFGTLEIPHLTAAAKSLGASPASGSLMLAAILIVATALLKSAQLPLHGWLLEVMETPTPVSALLHAGIVNAGGFLVLRLADVLILAKPALELLVLVGGATALIASLVMLTQTAIKVQLAWSTIAQMGFMLLQCGLGAFSSAVLHILAHSLYKAHAFLSSGSVMDLARASWTPNPGGQPHPARLLIALATVTGLTFATAAVFGLTIFNNPGQIALGCVLLIGLVHLIANAIDEHPSAFVILRAGALSAAVAGAYFALQTVMAAILAKSVPVRRDAIGDFEIVTAGLVIACFAAATIFQNQMMRRANAPFWIAAYVHLRSGLYLNSISNRIVLFLSPKKMPNPPANI